MFLELFGLYGGILDSMGVRYHPILVDLFVFLFMYSFTGLVWCIYCTFSTLFHPQYKTFGMTWKKWVTNSIISILLKIH